MEFGSVLQITFCKKEVLTVYRFFSKCGGFVTRTVADFRNDCHFSIYYGFLRIAQDLFRRLRLHALSGRLYTMRNQWIQAYLKRQLAPVLSRYQEDTFPCTANENAPVWICWWTGLDTAPALVQQCISSIREQAGEHPVNYISQETYTQYLDIPEYMLKKVRSGKMGYAHLADYIRVKLLADYGGLWLDTTIYCSQQIPEECFSLPVFTCKGPVRKGGYISDYRWTTFCLGGWKGSPFYRFLTEAFEAYWQNHDWAVDYLFFDHIILTAYENLPAIRTLLDNIPDNNIHRDDLQAAMNAALPADNFESVLQPDTALYKLSWRETYSETAADGQASIYQRFLKQ